VLYAAPTDDTGASQVNQKYLSLAEARSIAENCSSHEFPGLLDVSAYSQADPEALEYLAQHGEWFHWYLGLACLDSQQAKILARWDGNICFHNLAYLDREVAAVFGKFQGGVLYFDGLAEMNAGVRWSFHGRLKIHSGTMYMRSSSLIAEVFSTSVRHLQTIELLIT
jgi:hypothetical protein